MNFLAFLIAAFSISITALLSDNSDPTESAGLSLDLPLSDSLSLDIPDEGDIASLPLESPFASSLSLNPPASFPLDPSLSGLSPLNPTVPDKEPSSSVDNSDVISSQAADVPESIAFSPNIDPNPNANSADQPSIINPSPGYTEAQTSTDDSNQICDARSDSSQKRKKRDDSFCMTLQAYLFLPTLQDHEHGGDKSKEDIRRDDKAWERRYFPKDIDEGNELQVSNRMSSKGQNACRTIEGGIYRYALCCLGPEEFNPPIPVPGILPQGVTIDLFQPITSIMNVLKCIGFLDLRPYCTWGFRYCCKGIRNPFPFESWLFGFHGLNCIIMPALVPA